MKERTKEGADPASKPRKIRWGVTAVLVALAVCALTVVVFIVSVRQIQTTAQARLEAQANQSMLALNRRYTSAVTMLGSLRGLINLKQDVTQADFNHFITSSGFPQAFPQFNAIAYAGHVSSASLDAFLELMRQPIESGGTGIPTFGNGIERKYDEYFPMIFAGPSSAAMDIVGADLGFDSVRRDGLQRARDLGEAVISDDVVLRSDGRVGALLLVPIYSTGNVPDEQEVRRRGFDGAMGVSFAYEEFPLGSLDAEALIARGISAKIGSKEPAPFFQVPSSNSPMNVLYGGVETVRELQLNQFDSVPIAFTAAAAALLTSAERLQPFGITLTFLVIVIAAVLLIILLRRTQALAELRQRYDFTSAVSHQLRTPITRISWTVDSLAKVKGKADPRVLATVKGDVEALSSIIEDLLLYLEWGGMKRLDESVVAVPISELVEDALKHLADASKIRRVSVALGDVGGSSVLADRKRLSTALWFLIDNALTYSPKDSPVSIAASREGGGVGITVSDSGYGIPQAEQENVWSFFYRGTNASLGKNAGSGVGIPLCRIIVIAHGGTVEFTSKEGQGTTFVVHLPLMR